MAIANSVTAVHNIEYLLCHVAAGRPVLCSHVVYFFFFFFQAEDGIRDWSVTGVQTCALPISDLFVGETRPYITGTYSYYGGGVPCITQLRKCTRRAFCVSVCGTGLAGKKSGERGGGEKGRISGAPRSLKKKKKERGGEGGCRL